MRHIRHINARIAVALLVLLASPAFASGTGMPWEGPLDSFLQSITGPVSKALGAIAIIGCGIGMAFSEGGGGARKLLQVGLGLSIAFTATSFFLGFLGFSGGVAF